MEQLLDEIGVILFPEKNPVHPEILSAGIRVQVFPFGIFRIRRRFNRARPDMAKATGHADSVRTNQVFIIIVVGVGIEFFRIPSLLRRFVEVRIRKEAQADNSRRIAVQRPHGNVLTACANLDAGIFLFVFERVQRALFATRIQPQAEPIFVRGPWLIKAGLVYQAKLLPTRVPAQMLDVGMR